MASFFNMKGTTNNSFQLGIKGPIITRVVNGIQLPDDVSTKNLVLKTINFGKADSAGTSDPDILIDANNYMGNAATATILKTSRKIGFNKVQLEIQNPTIANENSISFDGSEDVVFDIKKISASLIDGNLKWSNLSSHGGITHETFALGDHDHKDTYLPVNSLFTLSSNTNIFDFTSTISDLEIDNKRTISFTLDLNENSIDGFYLKDGAVSSTKIANNSIEPTHFKSITTDYNGDYSGVIGNVKSANNVSTTILGTKIEDIFTTNSQGNIISAKKADLATSANKLSKTDLTIFGKSFNGEASVSGDITINNATPTDSNIFSIGSTDKTFKDLFLSGNVSASTIKLGDDTTNISINDTSITATGTSASISGFNSISATTFNGSLTGKSETSGTADVAIALQNESYIFGHKFNGTSENGGEQNITGDINHVHNIFITDSGTEEYDIGTASRGFNNVYAKAFHGNALSANKVNNNLNITVNKVPYTYNGSETVDINFDDFLKQSKSLVYKGVIIFDGTDLHPSAQYTPKASIGDTYIVSIKEGAANLKNTINDIPVENGDMIICNTAQNSEGSLANKENNQKYWNIIQSNINTDHFVNISNDQTIDGTKTFSNIKYKISKDQTEAQLIEDIFANKTDVITNIAHYNDAGTTPRKNKIGITKNGKTTELEISDVEWAENSKKIENALTIVSNDKNKTNSIVFDGSASKKIFIGEELTKSLSNNELTISHTNQVEKQTLTDINLDYGSELSVPNLTYDDYGHIKTIASQKYKLPDKIDTTDFIKFSETNTAGVIGNTIPVFNTTDGKSVRETSVGIDLSNNVSGIDTLSSKKIKVNDFIVSGHIQNLDINSQDFTHAIDFDSSSSTNFYESNGVWNFWKNTQSAADKSDNNLILKISDTGLTNKGKSFIWPATAGTLAITDDIKYRAIKINNNDFLVDTNKSALNITGDAESGVNITTDSTNSKIEISIAAKTYAPFDHNHNDLYATKDHYHNEYVNKTLFKIIRFGKDTSLDESLYGTTATTEYIVFNKAAKTGKYEDLTVKPNVVYKIDNDTQETGTISNDDWTNFQFDIFENWQDTNKTKFIINILYQNRLFRYSKIEICSDSNHTKYLIFETFGDDIDKDITKHVIKINVSTRIWNYYKLDPILTTKEISLSNHGTTSFIEKKDSLFINNDVRIGDKTTASGIEIKGNAINGISSYSKSDSINFTEGNDIYFNKTDSETVQHHIYNKSKSNRNIDGLLHDLQTDSKLKTVNENEFITASTVIDITQHVKATDKSFGGIKIFKNTPRDVTATASQDITKVYPVELNLNNQAYVAVPWQQGMTDDEKLAYATDADVDKKISNASTDVLDSVSADYMKQTRDETVSGAKTFTNANGIKIQDGSNTGTASMKYNSTDECLEFIFA